MMCLCRSLWVLVRFSNELVQPPATDSTLHNRGLGYGFSPAITTMDPMHPDAAGMSCSELRARRRFYALHLFPSHYQVEHFVALSDRLGASQELCHRRRLCERNRSRTTNVMKAWCPGHGTNSLVT
ncbi:hypothetical protein LshimejAT787_1801250 [Lyophyllum shimeji]|uniref:Uncharacterized protein n=1 Tax=Lyophyllum shimeji TaxID=47721 RepID=A0A9P3PZC6_LYOSH|nr:hypothetical protein LshimejAT787_1801250 [Lyophyllum shimeji]